MVARVFAVIVLVMAALASSWVGIDAGQEGRLRVTDAMHLARRMLDARALANDLVARQAEFALESLRVEGAIRAGSEYRKTLAALRQALDDIGRYFMDQTDRAIYATVRQQVDQFDQVHGEITALIRRGTRDDELAASTKVLEVAAPLARDIADGIRSLDATVAERAMRAAEDSGAAAERARWALVAFSALSLLVALLLANSLGQALAESAQLMKRLTEIARIDVLTGLPNRRSWDEELVKGLHRARRTSQPCTVALLDLDHFKRYNDTHGHQAGDALLRGTAQALAGCLRAGDLIARYGGEEFAVLLHGCDGANALKFFQRLHAAMLEGQTFSAGVAESDGKEEGGEAVQRADEALYRAKAGGRNQTVLAERARAAP
ncbi:MAG TPA: GGDEF domain-containing protein [Burkholderiales bacterium]|nr:GGDEF domain-containing protein [Burkholderiales bacterium]